MDYPVLAASLFLLHLAEQHFFLKRQVNSAGDQKELLLQQKLTSSMNPICCPDVSRTLQGHSAKGLWPPSKSIIPGDI